MFKVQMLLATLVAVFLFVGHVRAGGNVKSKPKSSKNVRLHGLCVADCDPNDPRPERTSPPRNLTFRELYEGLEDCTVLLVDVRTRHEYYRDPGHVPGSFNIPLDEVQTAFDHKAMSREEFFIKYGFDRPTWPGTGMVLTCLKNIRAPKAISILEKLGYTDVDLFPGALTDWADNGGRYCRYGPLPQTSPAPAAKKAYDDQPNYFKYW